MEYIPAATGNKAATASTPALLKPFKSPVGGASCRVMATVMAPRKTTQVGSLSHAMRANIATSKSRVSQACMVPTGSALGGARGFRFRFTLPSPPALG